SASISAYLASKNLPPKQEWLQSFMPTVRPSTPIQALQKTALFRMLATDIQTSVTRSATTCLPTKISNPSVKETKLPGPLTVQLLDIEDIGRSRWSQVEAIEARERGETTKGREVIRIVPDENASERNTSEEAKSCGPHKLLLQDAAGTLVYGFEVNPIAEISLQMSIGSKLVLRDVTVARGICLLEPQCVELLGGKVDTWDQKRRSEMKERL
ncbi:hypothetical protein BAUCODRAFT_54407, partial [Baudoinia panamericana UAMH 10762]